MTLVPGAPSPFPLTTNPDPNTDPDTEIAAVRLLDDATANRIAAGEVVERPSSVVKELVENALDAGAARIDIELDDGGKRRIVVRDNGCGMGRADAVLCLQRHATSKIRDADDLFAIQTLGFRGEALPSIASVCDFTLLTKRPGDDAATEVIVRAGEIVEVRDAAGPDGTCITVENLFFAVPARLKFLKTTQTELNHAVEFVQRLMLAYPKIAFRLTHDSHEMVSFPGGDARFALAHVFGRDVAKDMVALRYVSPALTVHGFVSKPSVSRATRSAQSFFVNGRQVRSRIVQHAFDQAFRALMTTERYPVAAIFVEIDPALVDVNVHPAKTEVRFTRDGDVYAAVKKAVEGALLDGGLVPEVSVQSSLDHLTTPDTPRPERFVERQLPRRPSLSTYVGLESAGPASGDPFAERMSALSRPMAAPPGGDTGIPSLDALRAGDQSSLDAAMSPDLTTSRSNDLTANDAPYIGFDGYRIGRLRVLGQSRNTYIVAETDDALLLIDQHIAHERVLYERMMDGARELADSWGVIAQHLALPQTIELGPAEARIALARLVSLERAGFILEPFGGETFVVRAVPATIADKAYLEILRAILDELAFASAARRLLVPHESAVIMASCKMAVKKGDPLTIDEMSRLLEDLARMKNPFTCPHGRPVLLALSHREMDRKFHRIGPH